MTTSTSRPTKSSIAARVARLPDTPFAELKILWSQLFDIPLPTHNRSYVERRIAFRLQELEMAQKQPQLLASNKMRIDALLEQIKPAQKVGRGELVRLVPGTVLTRDFMGQTHRVVAMPNGEFEYNGKPYSSLTAIACEIAGTRWSGPAFFGLRDGAKKPRKGTGA
ncbi:MULTISPECIES: DUF2924 domain-containing protein [Ralstonia solanacearum species complex]|uniref:Putative bacteriophage related protein n=2 Tax=Ralstonia solanacearum species complex TaxID=3116862 RepID=A0A0S4WMP1_RALSL|nr:DUF2924 domain-containing protein [Ralstonia pseudosolanacearum]CUV31609.1 putative bacteriophage related protein [Ralstonia solanacearum]MDO3514996.1 DUF2924 domain-containing protein [Ralstonia pseudosolanacearum]MDO3522651.1 DUF2924 domain-containing protein [Ralstonia pseudosolanacearum]MDO3530088.1 DUF2924 domain-containing protein [Ralstonia pseudosolanacearum]MDO3534952.1 DUF2924 domain-containing protein [Ralstonia pseudosolanacearum]